MTAYLGRPASKPTDLVTVADLAERVNVVTGASAYAGDIGDGATTIYDVAHDLGTRDVSVTLYANTATREEVDADVWHLDANTTRLIFATAPAFGAYRVVILRAGTPANYSGGGGQVGPPGAPGADGAAGAPGRDGVDGRDGAPGSDGIDGAPGPPGRDGIDGRDGATGPPGRDGVDGLTGPPGSDGLPGRDSRDGVDGAPGLPGADGSPGAPGRDGIDGRDGAPGPPGADGEADPVSRYLTLTRLF